MDVGPFNIITVIGQVTTDVLKLEKKILRLFIYGLDMPLQSFSSFYGQPRGFTSLRPYTYNDNKSYRREEGER
ncbi:hypothetical protein D5F53_13515 [Paenibacillus lautus]|uniref:Uncharacterized protein n=1 Tax=Paenibacillus lautus TaxID=1401 RepID=A0A385TPA9_PAELA|nr:hypothetical protein D5F53_13515 [Paenibacillus lautus]